MQYYVNLCVRFTVVPLSLYICTVCVLVYRQCLESESDRVPTPATDLRLHYSSLIANIINSFFDDPRQLKLFTRETRYSLFYLIAGWSGPFWHHHTTDIQEHEERYMLLYRFVHVYMYVVLN